LTSTAEVADPRQPSLSSNDRSRRDHLMATFIDVHDGFVGVTPAQFEAAHQQDLEIQSEEGVSFDHAWLDPVSGKAFCLVTGPSRDAVVRIHERAGHPASEVYELPIAV
jgi:hypothetical protein